MKALYLDLVSGISGDMFIGALLDAGVRFEALERALTGLGVDGFHLHAGKQSRSGIQGTKFDVHLEAAPHPHPHDSAHAPGHSHAHGHGAHLPHAHPHAQARADEPGGLFAQFPPLAPLSALAARDEHSHASGIRDFGEIKRLIADSQLSAWVKEKATRVFGRVAAAEGKVHGLPPDRVHFHEVGALDSIVDIVGACVALELLGKPAVLASGVVDGTGWVRCAHGTFPVPAPATLEILAARGVTLSQCEEPHELITPTGAALLAEFVERFGRFPELQLERVGYGIGTRENQTRPNVLRVLLAELDPTSATITRHDWETDVVTLLETNVDDLSAELLGPFIDSALAAGALDAFHTAVQMKKGRPGVLLSVLCAAADADRLTELILRETSAFGVRRTAAERRKLRREFRPVSTRFGTVAVKLGLLDGQVVQAAPEFEDCRRCAAAAGVPVKEVYAAAVAQLHLPG